MEADSVPECFVCKQDVVDDSLNVTRGLETFIRVSKERGDNFHLLLQKQSSVQMHNKCRERYTIKSRGKFAYNDLAKHYSKRLDHLTSPKRQKKRSCGGFDFKNNCLFCALPASIEKEKKRGSLLKKRSIILVSGWKRAGDVLLPVQNTKEPAPSELLKMIFCQCKTGCEKNCSCLKAGLKCSPICGSCQVTQCLNYKKNEGIFPEELEVEGLEQEEEEETEGLEGREAEIQLEEETAGIEGGEGETEQEGIDDESVVDDDEYGFDSDEME